MADAKLTEAEQERLAEAEERYKRQQLAKAPFPLAGGVHEQVGQWEAEPLPWESDDRVVQVLVTLTSPLPDDALPDLVGYLQERLDEAVDEEVEDALDYAARAESDAQGWTEEELEQYGGIEYELPRLSKVEKVQLV